MEIPRSFKLFGSTITIEFNNDKCDKEDAYGIAKYKTNKIYLSEKTSGDKMESTEIEVTFLHEVLHFVLLKVGYEKLSGDEAFVGIVSRALHQFLTTQEL